MATKKEMIDAIDLIEVTRKSRRKRAKEMLIVIFEQLQAENKRLKEALKIENKSFVDVCRACGISEKAVKEHNDLVQQAIQGENSKTNNHG